MKVLHVISSMEIGGAQRLLSDLLPIQNQQGLDVKLLVLKTEENVFSLKVAEAGVPIISFEVNNFRNPFLSIKVRSIIKEYDVVHAHLVHALYICSIAARGLNTKLIYTEHSTSNNRRGKLYFRPIEKYIYGRYDKLVSNSQQTQDALQLWLQSKDSRFVVINNGVDTKAFASLQKDVIPKSLIMVSRFVSSKDQETVIRAMKLIDKDATLKFVGNGENLDYCKQLAKDCGVYNRVQFLGTRADVADLIAGSYIGIQSSYWEGFGLTAVEMMACGKPVVASEVDGLKQVVDGAGMIFPVGDSERLASIINLLLADEHLYKETSLKCKEKSKQFDIGIMASAYVSLYETV